MIECEYCNNLHDGSYASGRFCGLKCSRGFSTKKQKKSHKSYSIRKAFR